MTNYDNSMRQIAIDLLALVDKEEADRKEREQQTGIYERTAEAFIGFTKKESKGLPQEVLDRMDGKVNGAKRKFRYHAHVTKTCIFDTNKGTMHATYEIHQRITGHTISATADDIPTAKILFVCAAIKHFNKSGHTDHAME